MKLATLKQGGRDGTLVVASRDLAKAVPVSDIAHQLGYDDPAYFSRFFAKSAGQSPSAYAGPDRGS